MKVLFVTRKWAPAVGGMELYSRELTAAMAAYADIDVEALPGRADGRPPSALSLVGFVLRMVGALTLRGRRYDVIHFGDFVLFPLTVWAAIVAPWSRRAVTVHGLDLIYGRRKGWKPFVYQLYFSIARLLQGAAHIFIANSSATAAVAREMGLRNVAAVPLGVSLLDETELSGGDEVVQTPLLRGNERYVLFVGRIVPRKGLAWFAENVLGRLPSGVGLKIVGGAWDQAELEQALKAPYTEYLGRIDDEELRRIRRSAAATIMPNRAIDDGDMEGFGLAALEAAADGSVLVASGIEGITDAVIDGETGFLVPEGDADAWDAKLNEVLAWTPAGRAQFTGRAREIIAERYSWDRVARDTLALAAG